MLYSWNIKTLKELKLDINMFSWADYKPHLVSEQLSWHFLFLAGCHQFLDFSNSFPWIQPLGVGAPTVHDGVAAIQTEGALLPG